MKACVVPLPYWEQAVINVGCTILGLGVAFGIYVAVHFVAGFIDGWRKWTKP